MRKNAPLASVLGADDPWWKLPAVVVGCVALLYPALCCGVRIMPDWCKKLLFGLGYLMPSRGRENWRREIEQAEEHYSDEVKWARVLCGYLRGWPRTLAAEWLAWWSRRRRLRLLMRCEFQILQCSRPISNAELRQRWCNQMLDVSPLRLAAVLADGRVDLSDADRGLVLKVRVWRPRRSSRGRHRA